MSLPPPFETGVPGQRRPHRKSRSGCRQCKQKKIKCDERKPSCTHCTRAQSLCSFLGPSSNASSASTVRAELSTSSQVTRIDASISELSLSGASPIASRVELDVKNLELLHFYTTTTSFTLSNRPELQQIWQQVVPRIAFTHSFLLHGILAFSALHLARSQPERKNTLYADASTYYDVGLSLFRVAILDITSYNYDACLAFSTINAAYSWASSDQTGELFFPDTPTSEQKASVDWVSLLRGVYTLLATAGEWMTSSSMKPIVYPRPMNPKRAIAADPEVTAKLTAISQLWDSSPGKFSVTEVEALNEALFLLLGDYGLATSSDDGEIDIVSIVYGWPIKIPTAFLDMVYKLKPEALIILAHYSLLLNMADHIWFTQGMSRRLLQSVYSRIGDEWEGWIAWPLQKLVLAEFKGQGGN